MTNLTDLNSAKTEEGPDGVFRTTLSYGAEAMLCHFDAKQGARIPLPQSSRGAERFLHQGQGALPARPREISGSSRAAGNQLLLSAPTSTTPLRSSRTASSSRCSHRCGRSTPPRNRWRRAPTWRSRLSPGSARGMD